MILVCNLWLFVNCIGCHCRCHCVTPRQDFKNIISHVRKSPLGRRGVTDVSGHKKARQMLWCVAEASRSRKRKLWQLQEGEYASTTVYQDGRKAKLTIRFSMANSRLERASGYLGTVDLAKEHSLDAVGIQEGTMAVIKNMHTCTRSPSL